MTATEEQALRCAARAALARSSEIVLVGSKSCDGQESLEAFAIIEFNGARALAIVVPEAWFDEEGAEAACQAILRQESKALAGKPLD